MKDTENFNMRSVSVHGVKYLRAEDVAKYIADLAATEETDVRIRFNEAAFGLIDHKKKERK